MSSAADLRRAVGLLHARPGRVAAAVGLGSLALGAAVGLSAVSAWLIARASQMPAVLDLTVAVVAVRALGISRGVFRYAERLASHDVALRGMAALRDEVYSRLASGRSAAVTTLRRGDLLARFGSDVDAIGDVVVKAFIPALVALVVGAGTVGLVAAFSPAAAAVLAAMLMVAGAGGPLMAGWAARRAEAQTVTSRARMSAATTTLLEDGPQLQVSGRLEAAMGRLAEADAEIGAAQRRSSWPAALAPALVNLAMGLSVLAALLIGIPAVGAGTLAPVELAVIVLTPLAAFEGVSALPGAAIQVLRSAAAAQRVMGLLDAAKPTGRPGQALATGTPTVTARDLAVGWPGREPLLTHVSIDVRPGRAIAVVGPSGVGKSTLLATLAGLICPAGGSVLIGGVDSCDLAPGEAARTVVYTAEDAHVFNTTVLENLRVARGDVTEEEAAGALEQAGLGDLVARLPQGVHTMLGADATMVAGGERRRLLLARALLAPAPLMLLDEPAEHLDPARAGALMDTVLSVGRERGVLVVTHRAEGLQAADEVIDLAGVRA